MHRQLLHGPVKGYLPSTPRPDNDRRMHLERWELRTPDRTNRSRFIVRRRPLLIYRLTGGQIQLRDRQTTTYTDIEVSDQRTHRRLE